MAAFPSPWPGVCRATPLAGGAATLLGAVLLACASAAEPTDPEPPEPAEAGAAVEVSGRVVAVGSEPHVLLVVVTEAGAEYELLGELAAELWGLQQRQVRVRGPVLRQAYGPGFPAQLEVEGFTLLRGAGAEPAGR